jgi:hypothetical protein
MGRAKQGKQKKQGHARYCVRAEGPGGIEEIGLGHDLAAEIAFARRYHAEHGVNVWVWSLKDGKTCWRSPRLAKGAGR